MRELPGSAYAIAAYEVFRSELADVNKAQVRHKRHISSWGSVSDIAPSLSRRVFQMFTKRRTVGAGVGKLVAINRVVRGPF